MDLAKLTKPSRRPLLAVLSVPRLTIDGIFRPPDDGLGDDCS